MNNWLELTLLRIDECTDSKNACMELVNLYRGERPLSALAFGRKVRRLGEDIELTPLVTAVEALRRADWKLDPEGCYRLGRELSSHPVGADDLRWAAALLDTAAGAEGFPRAGEAALCLADLLSCRPRRENIEKAHRLYALARSRAVYDLLPVFDGRTRSPGV